MQTALKNLAKIFEGELKYDSLHKTIYATDASVYRKLPLAVAFPKSEEGIIQLIRFATKHEIGLIPRTAGTSLAGQCVGEGIIVDVSKYFTEIISFDPIAKTVTVQPGVVRDELNAYLKPHGLFFGPNTSTSNRCMIGGMVGNNSSGTTSIQYGVTREKVLQMETILSNGEKAIFTETSKEDFWFKLEELSLEASIYKNIFNLLEKKEVQKEIIDQFPKKEIHRRNTGYAVDTLLNATIFNGDKPFNMCTLLCGSEGTLAFTTAITLQLDALPPLHTVMLATHYDNLQNCLKDVVNVMKHNLHTCELMDDVILERTKKNTYYNSHRFFIKKSPKALLLLELKGDSEETLATEIAALEDTVNQSALSYHTAILKGDDVDKALALRKAGLGLLGNMVGDHKAVACIEDTAVALEDLPSYIEEFSAIMDKHKQKAVYYAHAGAGELHLRPILNLKTDEGVGYFRIITTEVAQLVKKYKGSFSGEHGDGIVRSEFIPFMVGEKNYELFKKIKKIFDPNNIFNPGKIVDAEKMDAALRTKVSSITPKIETKFNFKDSEGIVRLAEKCNGSGDCRKSADASGTMCPSYHATKNEKDTTRARANMLREVLYTNKAENKFDSEDLKKVFDLCISCKACATECPSNVDMATAKAEFLYQYRKSNGTSFSEKLFAKSTFYNRLAAKVPAITNALYRNTVIEKWIKNIGGIALERSLPSINLWKNKFSSTEKSNGKTVILFVDEFSKYLDGSITEDAVALLTRLGYTLKIVDTLDSARALISKGFLDEAKNEIDKNISFLKEFVDEITPLVGIEPSAILGFRDEFLRLATDENSAKQISNHTFLIEEFLANEMENGTITKEQFNKNKQSLKIHVHCHQKALSNQKVTFDILNFPENYRPTLIISGCCGMAGSFGYEKDHYETSMQIGELRLFPSVRKADMTTIIAANGTSCRHQIKDGTLRDALHPVTILRNALL
jgi:FAD/FMN-containing dehydrogenase/Fe-S oxidoreductase